jgi:crossover junction endodeoxyribonuclease RuvC
VTYIGIDPGKSGGIAVISDDSGEGCETFAIAKMTETDIAATLMGARPLEGSMFAYIEKVHAMPGQGVTSMFTFGQSYGFLRDCLISLGIPFEEATPRKWQAALGCLSGGDKNVTKARAQQLFPSVKVTHAIADALLIAEYCRRVRKSK